LGLNKRMNLREFITIVESAFLPSIASLEPLKQEIAEQFTAESPKTGRLHTTYDVKRPAKPWVKPEPVPKPEYKQLSPEEFDDLMGWFDQEDRKRA
jgi:hypothetical protein